MPIAEAVAALRRGEVVGMPTDTVYGIAADPHQEAAVAKLYELKGRSGQKAIPVLAASVAAAGMVAELSPHAEEIALAHWPGALTLVLPRRTVMPGWVGDPVARTVAVRVPDHPLALRLLAEAGPLSVTSANPAGAAEAVDDAGARAMFGDAVAVYLEGRSAGDDASTVVDLTVDPPKLLRAGPVPWPK